MKPCLEYLELMNAVLDGEATPAQGAALSAHLAQCSACAALYEDLKALREGSDALVTKAPESLKTGVMSHITAETSNVVSFPTKTKKKAANRWRSWAAMAAVFALIIGVGTTQDLFGGSSSAPMPDPSSAPAAAQEPAEAAQEIGDIFLTTDSAAASGASNTYGEHFADVHQYSSTEPVSEDRAKVSNPALETHAEAAPTAETSDLRLALDMVIHRAYGDSGYAQESTYADDGESSCQVRLLDGESVITEGLISYTGLSANGKFYCFAWTWADQTGEDALIYRYAVPLDLSYVMWAGDTPDMKNYDLTLQN